MSTTAPYPVHVQGRLDAPLSRWLWLVKWLLALPHYVVLAFLWIGFVLTSLVAFVAVLATGRYPRGLFAFNVGVLRWTWRVTYYAYGALGTDRYPPFTLADVPDYPARLDVDYPAHLSRGLVLVKSWLLAIPHYVVIGFFLGSSTWVASDEQWAGSVGLIGLLVLAAAVVLLFTGRYPRGMFDLVLGMNRWVLRVAAYAGLMTDTYPPFRLDLGSDDDPGSLALQPLPPAPSPTPPPPGHTPPATRSAGRVVGAVLTSFVGLLAFGMLVGGLMLLAVDRTQRDDGWLTSGSQALRTSTPALASEEIDLGVENSPDVSIESLLGDLKVRVVGRSDEPVFIGLAEKSEVASYLASFRHDVVTQIDGTGTDYTRVSGATVAPAPTEQSFWARSVSGTGPQTLSWTPDQGQWVLVVMNADGSSGVRVSAQVGAELPALPWLAAGLIVVGALLLVGSGVVVYLLLRG